MPSQLGQIVHTGCPGPAELACSVLNGHGVQAWVSGGLEVYGPELVKVLVAPADVPAAEDLLRAHGLSSPRNELDEP